MQFKEHKSSYQQTMKKLLLLLTAVAFAIGCQPDNNNDPSGETIGSDKDVTLSISLNAMTRTSLDTSDDSGLYPSYWSIGDEVMVNGVLSDKVTADEHNKPTATFKFTKNSISAPYSVVYPYCSLTSAEKSYVEFPAKQTYTKGSIAPNHAPMCGYTEVGNEITLQHLSAILHLPVKAANDIVGLKEVVVTSTSGAKLSGIFKVDCQSATLSATGSCKSSLTYTFPTNFKLLNAEICDLFIVVPAGEIGDCTIEFIGVSNDKMVTTWSSNEPLQRGVVYEFNTILYDNDKECELALRDLTVPTFKKYASDDEIKIMSFNVRTECNESDPTNNWSNRKEACVALIKDQMPSVIGFQEADFTNQWSYIKDQLAKDYAGYGVNRDNGKESGSGETMGILYNKRVIQKLDGGTFWLSETPNEPSKGFGASYCRNATWGLFKHLSSGIEFFYINTHLDHQTKNAQIEGMKLISTYFEKYKDTHPVFLTGDLNILADNVALDVIESYMYNTRYAAPEMLSDTNTTHNGWVTNKNNIIDHIYCSNYLEVVEYHTINENYGVPFVSDHYPVYAIIKLK